MAVKYDNLIQRALKCVDEAIKYDSDNCDKEAYVKYLESISVISTSLYTEESELSRDSKNLSVQQKQRLIDVAKQCLDRLDILFKKLNETSNKPLPKAQNCEEKYEEQHLSASTLKTTGSQEPNAKILESIDWITSEGAVISHYDNRILSPLEKAQQENKHLLATYKKRLSRAPTFSAQTNTYLELQRRLAENLQVARKQQEIYLNAIQEKQRRHLNEVTKRLIRGDEAASKEFYRRKELCTKIIEYEKHQAWVAGAKTQLSENPGDVNLTEMIVRHILRDENHPISEDLKSQSEKLTTKLLSIIESYNVNVNREIGSSTLTVEEECESSSSDVEDAAHNTPSDLEKASTPLSVKEDKAVDRFEQSYAQNAEDIELAIKNNNTFRNTLQLTLKKQKQALKKGSKKIVKQSKALEKIASDSEESNKNTQSLKAFELEALQRHLRNIAGDTQNVIEEVVEILSLAYSEMEQGENHERCYSIIENHVYSIVWPNLMKLCKAAYSLEETQMESAMKILGDCSPDKLGFNMSHTQPATEDYKTAVEHLKLLINMINPTKKLELLVKVAKLLCDKQISHGNRVPSKTKPIGADDFIPLLSYVCIQTKTPQLVCECQLLECVINPKHMLGEAGYCLTSLQTALHYIQILSSKKEEM